MKNRKIPTFSSQPESYLAQRINTERLINVKKVLEIKQTGEGIIMVRLEATKRRKIWLKKVKLGEEAIRIYSCDPKFCSLYYKCFSMCSPLKKYSSFGKFCNYLFNEYHELALRLATEFGITNINQVVPIKKNRIVIT